MNFSTESIKPIEILNELTQDTSWHRTIYIRFTEMYTENRCNLDCLKNVQQSVPFRVSSMIESRRYTIQSHLQFGWNFVDLINEYNIYFIKIHLV